MSNNRNKIQREKDYVREAELYIKGKYQYEIAEIIGVTPAQVGYDLKKIQKRWLTQTNIKLEKHQIKQLAKIDQVEREAWEAWQRSRDDFKSKINKALGIIKDAKTGELRPSSVDNINKIENQDGNPKYLEIVLKCIERRNKMLGLEFLNIKGDQDNPLKVVHEHKHELVMNNLRKKMESDSEFRNIFSRFREQLQRPVLTESTAE